MGIVGRGTIAFFMVDNVGSVIFFNVKCKEQNVRSIVFVTAGLPLMIFTGRNSDRQLVFNTVILLPRRCRRRTDRSPPDTVRVQVDLSRGVVRTFRDFSSDTSAAASAAPLVTAVGDATPSKPTMSSCTSLGASKVSIATQTTCILASCSSSSCSNDSSTSSLSSATSMEVSLFDKSMWGTRSPSTTDQLDDSAATLVDTDTSPETVFSATRYTDTTYFEESSEAGKQVELNLMRPGTSECGPREVIELCPLSTPSNPCSVFPLQVIQECPEDSALAQSITTTLLTESSTCISPPPTPIIPLDSLDFGGLKSSGLRSYNPFNHESAESDSSDLESDRESFYTCAGGNEEASSVKEIDLSFDANHNVNQLENAD